MGAARIVSCIVGLVTTVVTGCSDGGPPGAWTHTRSHPAPDTAADGGQAEAHSDAAESDNAAVAGHEASDNAAVAGHEASDNAAVAGHEASDNAAVAGHAASDAGSQAKSGALAALCDGSPGITFSALAIGGGQPQPGTQVMAENGYNFLIIEGNCQYWALSGLLAHVTTGKLSDAEAQDVVESFQLDRWTLNTGSTTTRALDGPTYYMLFGRDLNALDCTNDPAADGCKSIAAPGKFGELSSLLLDYSSKRDELSEMGEPLTGDVRYVLVGDAETLVSDWKKPGSWPIGDPNRVAISMQDAANYRPGHSQLARGGDAQALQDVWSQFLKGQISGHDGSLGIPVEVAGKRYALFLRDSIPLENDRGLILF